MNKNPPKDHAKQEPPSQPECQPDIPPPEDEYGGGDICSLDEETSTDDDKPLD